MDVNNNESPLQKVVADELITGTAAVFFVTVIGADTAEHPELLVTVTVNVPLLEAVTLCVVAPPDDHK